MPHEPSARELLLELRRLLARVDPVPELVVRAAIDVATVEVAADGKPPPCEDD